MGKQTFLVLSVFIAWIFMPSINSDVGGEFYKDLLEMERLKEMLLGEEMQPSSSLHQEVTEEVFEVNLLMPNITPQHANDYKCFSIPTPEERSAFIVGFEPQATMKTAHHMLLYGCDEPGSSSEVWDCGEMEGSPDIENHTPCNGVPRILYAWAMDAPPLDLPEGVGFEVGGDTSIQYLVLQVHYATAEPFKDGKTDASGIKLKVTEQMQRYQAGVYFMGADGEMPAHKTVHLESACIYNEEPVLHPFAFRVHAHQLGEVISAYRVRDEEWTVIGKRDPHLPQMFYPIENKDLTIESGDVLATRCTMKSNRDKTTMIGPTGDDEMCNFYMMYYTESRMLPEFAVCYTGEGFKWSDYLFNIPDKEASTLSKATKVDSGEKPEP